MSPPRTLSSPQGPWLEVSGKRVLNLCSNNYLGLANHPRLKQAAIEAIDRYGVGVAAARTIAGNHVLHVELERRLANFKRRDDAILFSSGFAANLAILPVLAGTGDHIFSDDLNHASIVDSCRLSRSEVIRYGHANSGALREMLARAPASGRRVIVTDGVFSMDGDVAPLDELVGLADEYDALVVVDDAHGEGVLGEGGRGIVEHFDLHSDRIVEVGTLSKAFGCVGGYACGSASVVAELRTRARPYLFSTGLPPGDAAAALAALEVLEESRERLVQLWKNTRWMRHALGELGFECRGSTPIIPVMFHDDERAKRASDTLFDHGVFAAAIVYPMVPRGAARIRLIISAEHSAADLELAAEAFGAVSHGGPRFAAK